MSDWSKGAGNIEVTRGGRVRWTMDLDDARDLAELIEHHTSPDDLARIDVRRLRDAADESENPSPSRG